MNVVICHTSDFGRTIVLVNDCVAADSARTLLLDEHELVESYRRMSANVAIATLPPGAIPNYG